MTAQRCANWQFSAQVIVARKIESTFRGLYQADENKFYDDLVTLLFAGQLHRSSDNYIVFAQRGDKKRQHALAKAVERSIHMLPPVNDWKAEVNTKQSIQEPAIQIIDYVNWAVQRAFERGEMRYFEFLREKLELVRDIFDFEKRKRGEKCCYDRDRNPFDIKKASPLS
jgi:methylaspartate ammonia-lyase